MSEKLWNDIVPFSVGASIADSIEVEYAWCDEHLPVLDNESINAGMLLRTLSPHIMARGSDR